MMHGQKNIKLCRIYYGKKRDLLPSARFELQTLFPAARNTSKEEIRYLIYISRKCGTETCVPGIKETPVQAEGVQDLGAEGDIRV